jgi:hypothetical protein
MPTYVIQNQQSDSPIIGHTPDIRYEYAAPIDVQDNADYIIERTVVLYPTDNTVFQETEKSTVF